jgi:hypothetical protein
MQSWHMANPHLHLQQKGAVLLQQLQLLSLALSRFCLYEDLSAESAIFCYPVPANCLTLEIDFIVNWH